MINNCICNDCDHSQVCENYLKKILVFDESAKKDLGIELTLNKCVNFATIRETGEEA